MSKPLHVYEHPHFRLALEACPAGMLVTDSEGRIREINRHIEELFGYLREDLLGQAVELLIPQELARGHGALRESFVAEPSTRRMGLGRDLRARKRDGSEFPVEIGLNQIRDGTQTIVLCSIADITRRKTAELALQDSVREKELLLREVQHRVKNNLQVMVSLLSLKARAVSDPASRTVFQEVQDSVHSIALVHEMLHQSGTVGRMELRPYIEGLCQNVMASWGRGDRGVALRIEVSEVRLPLDTAVPCGLIVNELLTNALKHAFPDGRGELRVTARQEKERVFIEVADTGIGMGSLDGSRESSLGLQLVRGLAHQLNAQLQFSGPPGTIVQLSFEVTP